MIFFITLNQSILQTKEIVNSRLSIQNFAIFCIRTWLKIDDKPDFFTDALNNPNYKKMRTSTQIFNFFSFHLRICGSFQTLCVGYFAICQECW